MTRYLGLRFEAEYREPGTEPFRFDHPTVGVGRQRVRQLAAVADGVGVDTDDVDALCELLRVEAGPYRPDTIVHDDRDSFRLEPHEVSHLRSLCASVREACREAGDLDGVRTAIESAGGDDCDDVREAVGPGRYDQLRVHDRCRDIVAVCDAALEQGVHCELY